MLTFMFFAMLVIFCEIRHPTTLKGIANTFRFWGYVLALLLIVVASPFVAVYRAVRSAA